jgi:hypothetical protein
MPVVVAAGSALTEEPLVLGGLAVVVLVAKLLLPELLELRTLVVEAVAQEMMVLLLAQAAPALLSSSTPCLVKPSLYSKARLRGNVLLV